MPGGRITRQCGSDYRCLCAGDFGATRHLDAKHIAHDGTAIVGYAFFIPIFFVNIGLQVQAKDIFAAPMLIAIITIAASCHQIIRRWHRCAEWRHAMAGIIDGRGRHGVAGEVALVLAGAALAVGAISGTVFSALIIMTLVTTLITPPLLRWMLPRDNAVVRG
jgi:Kef-type K+ transport system membrane component KefB